MLHRKIETLIKKWTTNSNKALLIEGARQVGKTTTIRNVFKQNNIDYVEFNLIENTQFLSLLKNINTMTCQQFYERISAVTSHKLIPGKTIIFIDEVQECKDLITKVKFLVEDAKYKFIFSGSLLGIEIRNLKSAPVGFLESIKMYPMDLEEFCHAIKIPDKAFELLKANFKQKNPVETYLHETFMQAFKNYLIVGGMPNAVQAFVDTQDYKAAKKIHKQIIELYKKDFTKYEDQDKKLRLISAYKNIPSELNKQNKRFQISNIEKGLKFCRAQATLDWLNAAGVSIPVYNSTEPTFPLEINKKSNLLKLFASDIGLLNSMFDDTLTIKILNDDADINYGALYENFIAQELNTHGYSGYYYKSKKYGEIDFLIEDAQEIIPIEVKSGKAYAKHKALDHIMANEVYNIKQAVVFHNNNLSYSEVAVVEKSSRDYTFKDKYKILYLPIYMAMFFDKNNVDIPKANLRFVADAIKKLS